MTDERNIAHDKKVAHDKKAHGEAVVENSAIVPQPGKKPPLIDDDTAPSISIAKQMHKPGMAKSGVQRDDDGDDGKADR